MFEHIIAYLSEIIHTSDDVVTRCIAVIERKQLVKLQQALINKPSNVVYLEDYRHAKRTYPVRSNHHDSDGEPSDHRPVS